MKNDIWNLRAKQRDILRNVLDPADEAGLKNRYIDIIHKYYLRRYFIRHDGGSTLDFGCGVGRISSWLAKFSRHVVGVDTSPEFIKKAKTLNKNRRISYYRGGLDILGSNRKFDRAISVWVLQHILTDREIEKTAGLLGNLLKRNGYFCLIEQVCRHNRYMRLPDTGEVYLVHRTMDEYTRIFSQNGFRLRRAVLMPETVWGFVYRVIRKNRLPRLSLKVLPLTVLFDIIFAWAVLKIKKMPATGRIDCLLLFKKSTDTK